MYPVHPRRNQPVFEQLWLFPQLAPPRAPRRLGQPARVISRPARIAVLALRAHFGQALRHPGDLWEDRELADRLGEVIEVPRGGTGSAEHLAPQVRCVGLESSAFDRALLEEIRVEEDKVLAMYEALQFLQRQEAEARKLARHLKAVKTASAGQIRHALARARDALRG